MKNIKDFVLVVTALVGVAACNSNPQPVSKDIIKTTVTVNGKKDSVINNPEKNYGDATVSEPCVKCLLGIIQATKNYKMLTTSVPPENIIYDVNWITSKTPKDIGSGNRIVNGMNIAIILKDGGAPKKLVTYVYNNENYINPINHEYINTNSDNTQYTIQ